MKYEIDLDIYSADAIKIAKNIIDKEDLIKINIKDEKAEAIFDEKNITLFNNLMNEALSQQCRIDTSKKNSKVAELLTTLVILSALGKGGGKK
ncbi:MAG: hypothetical protein ACP5IO_00835 [Elusimicrobiales bacterium]